MILIFFTAMNTNDSCYDLSRGSGLRVEEKAFLNIRTGTLICVFRSPASIFVSYVPKWIRQSLGKKVVFATLIYLDFYRSSDYSIFRLSLSPSGEGYHP
jgi:hypothetical protein